MKKLYSLVAATGLAIAISGCGSNSVSVPSFANLDERALCSIESNGIESTKIVMIFYNNCVYLCYYIIFISSSVC